MSDSYVNFLGCCPQAHFGSTLNGNDAYKLMREYQRLMPLFAEIVDLPFVHYIIVSDTIYTLDSLLCIAYMAENINNMRNVPLTWNNSIICNRFLSSQQSQQLVKAFTALNNLGRSYHPIIKTVGGTDRLEYSNLVSWALHGPSLFTGQNRPFSDHPPLLVAALQCKWYYHFSLTLGEIGVVERGIDKFCQQYREFFPTFPPKLHILEHHVVPQLRRWKRGSGLMNEQGGESAHKSIRKIAERYGMWLIFLKRLTSTTFY